MTPGTPSGNGRHLMWTNENVQLCFGQSPSTFYIVLFQGVKHHIKHFSQQSIWEWEKYWKKTLGGTTILSGLASQKHPQLVDKAVKKHHLEAATIQIKQHLLTQSCKVCWNLVYDKFKGLSEQKWPITTALSDSFVTKPSNARMLSLKDEDWQLIELQLSRLLNSPF